MRGVAGFIGLWCVLLNDCLGACPTGFYAINSSSVAIVDECPAGAISFGQVDACTVNSLNTCWLVEQNRALCGAGVTNLKTSGGLSFPLYSTRITTPSLCVKYNDTTCYVDLESGSATGAINVKYNGATYHTVAQ